MRNWITARAPATVANLNCGFDQLSLAIDGLYDDVAVCKNGLDDWRILEISNGEGIPTDAVKNTCTVAMESMRKHLNSDIYCDVKIYKGYKAGSGLGSSAASAVAALWSYNAALGYPLTKMDIIRHAMSGEAAVSGAPIADNVAAASLGGIVLVRSANEFDFQKLPVPNIYVTCILPDVRILTKEARHILPSEIPLHLAVRQSAHLGGFITALFNSDLKLLRDSMQDFIVEPHRKEAIPAFDEMKNIALNHGALSFGISGSGPAVFALHKEKKEGQLIVESCKAVLTEQQVESVGVTGLVNKNGVRIID